jgi:hypothetical protein
MIRQLSITVGRSCRFARDTGQSTALYNKPRYKELLNELKNDPATGAGLMLPWPTYRSGLWKNMFQVEYHKTPTELLVGGLMPLLYERDGMVAVIQPFGLTTLVTDGPHDVADADVPEWLVERLRQPIEGSGTQLRDGAPASFVNDLPTLDSLGEPYEYAETGTFIVLSALSNEPALAARTAEAEVLASLFESAPTRPAVPATGEADSVKLRRRSGVASSSSRLGIAFPTALPRAPERLKCFHHNVSTLIAILVNLAGLMANEPTQPAAWYRTRAAQLVSALYFGEPLVRSPDVAATPTSIYKSRAARVWIDERNLATLANPILMSQPGTPLLPVPAH